MRPSTILAIAFITVIAILLYPLLMFAMEVPQNPSIFGLRVDSELFNETHVLLRIKVSYGGSIPVTDVKLELMRRALNIGDLQAGEVKSINIIVSIEEATELQRMDFTFKFRIAGLYGVEVKMIG